MNLNFVIRLSLVLLFLLFNFCRGHVVLTYPPARTFSNDGTWASKTNCPVGKGIGPRTSIVAGSILDVTWKSSYPHKGGFKLEVLDSKDRPIMDLTPIVSGDKFLTLDPTVENYGIRLPEKFECIDCSIRLLRQAAEWNSNVTFISCADVDVVKRENYVEDCLKKGSFKDDHCTCQKTYTGSRCQYKDECLVDSDCGFHGHCVDIGGTSYPRRQCFCDAGWFGLRCDKESDLKSIPLNLESYNRQDLDENLNLYWRLLLDIQEIEIVVVAKGTSYVALGWRPNNVTAQCKEFSVSAERRSKQLVNSDNLTSTVSALMEDVSTSTISTTKETISLTTSKKLPRIRFPSRKPITTSTSTTAASTNSTSMSISLFTLTNRANSTSVTSALTSQAPFSTNSTSMSTSSTSISTHSEPISTHSESFSTHSESISTNSKPTSTISEPISTNSVSMSTSSAPISMFSSDEKPSSSVRILTSEKISTSVKTSESEQMVAQPTSNEAAVTSSELSEETLTSGSEEASLSSSASTEKLTETPSKNTFVTSPVDYSTSGSEESSQVTEVKEKSYTRRKKRQYDINFQAGPLFPPSRLHPMDCTDMVIGSARDNWGRVGDFYSRDQSTPQLDESLGGKDDLTAALAFEIDGVTTIAFRKKLIASESLDHSISDVPMHVIWAKGQEEGNYLHEPPVSMAEGVRPFYAQDELKYHGTGHQRGVASVHFFNEVRKDVKLKFHGEWKRPGDCRGSDCEYLASWEFDPESDDINFTIFTKYPKSWTGIGFSKDQLMNNSDAIIGWVNEDGRYFMMDMWINGGYAAPHLDILQNIDNQAGIRNESGTTLFFSRKRNTGDHTMDLAFSDQECLYMIFPYHGGAYNPVNKKLQKHEKTPAISSKKVCIYASGNGKSSISPVSENIETVNIPSATTSILSTTVLSTDTTTTTESAVPPLPSYTLAFRIPLEAPLQKSLESNSDKVLLALKEKIRTETANILQNATGFQDVVMGNLEKDSNTSNWLMVTMFILVDKNIFQQPISYEGSVKQIITFHIREGKIGNIRVDPTFIVIQEPIEIENENNFEPNLDEVKSNSDEQMIAIYAVITAVSALGLLVFIQILCTIYQSRHAKRTRMSKEQLITNSGWKDYSTSSVNNYNYEPFIPIESEPSSSRKKNTSSPTKSSTPEVTKINPRVQHLNNNRRSESLSRLAPAPVSGRGGFTNAYATHDRAGLRENGRAASPPRIARELQPDFYFMPSQRRYTGDVIRVSVDYNNPNYSGK